MIELQLNQTKNPMELQIIRTNTEALLHKYVEDAEFYANQTKQSENNILQQIAAISLQLVQIEKRLTALELMNK